MIKLQDKLFEHNHLRFMIAILGVAIKTALTVYIAFLLMDFTDVAISGNMDDLMHMLVSFFCFLIGYMLADTLTFYFKNRFLQKGMTQYKDAAFSNILGKHIASFQKETTSTYISALTNDVNSIETNYLEGCFQIVFQGLLFVGALASMAYLNLWLTGAVILSCLIPLAFSVIFGTSIAKKEKETSDNGSYYNRKRDI